MRQLFIDLDGVLADFDGYYETCFGIRPDKIVERPNFWRNIADFDHFYAKLPVFADALDLWRGARALHPRPIIMTGIPSSVNGADIDKRLWVAQHIDAHAQVICCLSVHKRLYGKPGDVLIDDWQKYRHLWEAMGGTFIVHTSAEQSLREAGKYF